jgi:hypothetical protein
MFLKILLDIWVSLPAAGNYTDRQPQQRNIDARSTENNQYYLFQIQDE